MLHFQDDIILVNGSTIISNRIGTVFLLFYVNRHTEKISLSRVHYCSKVDTKLISLGMFDRKRLVYSSQHGILYMWDKSSIIMVGRLIPHNLYEFKIAEASGKVIAILMLYTEIDFSRAMTAATSKSAADLFTWHCRLAYLNEVSVKRLSTIVPGMEIIQSQNTFLLCSVYIKAEMTQQSYWDVRLYSSQPRFCLHADISGGGQTYTKFQGYRYFILFICKATGHVWVQFFKKKSDTLPAFQNLVTLIYQQYGIWVCILHIDFGEFNSDIAAKYFEETGIIWESFTPITQQ